MTLEKSTEEVKEVSTKEKVLNTLKDIGLEVAQIVGTKIVELAKEMKK